MSRRSFKAGGFSRLGGLVTSTLGRAGLLKGVKEQQAADNWDKVVGPQIAAATAVEKVRDGVIYVCCRSSTWSSELALHKDQILKRLNAAVGQKVITDMRLSARGFKARSLKEEKSAGANTMETVALTDEDRAAAKAAAAAAPSEELARRIEKAVLTGRKRAKQEEAAFREQDSRNTKGERT